MITEERLSRSGETLTVRIPMRFEPRGGRKRIIGPDGEPVVTDAPMPPRVDDALIRALAKAWRWKRMLEGGGYASIGDLAAAEKVNFSYLCRVLRLSLLPPATVEAILDGRQEEGVTLERMLMTRSPTRKRFHSRVQTKFTRDGIVDRRLTGAVRWSSMG